MLKSNARNAVKDILPVWIALALITTAPYLLASARTPAGFAFTGVLTAYDDTFTYLAWMRQGADGRILLCDLYTSEQHDCEFFFPLWIFLGLASRLTGGHLVLTFHAARILSALLLLLAARSVARRVMKSRRRIRYSLWLYAMSGGLGWLVFAANNRGDLLDANAASGAVDLNLPEAIAFRSVYAQVHFVVGAALTFAAINSLFIALVEQKRKQALIAGVLVSLLALTHPYQVVVALAVAAVALLLWPWLKASQENLRKRYSHPARAAAVLTAASLPGVIYLIYLRRFNELVREWLRDPKTFSPPPVEYILGFGIVAVFAVVALCLMRSSAKPYAWLLLIWAVVHSALLYAPSPYQRRFVEGLQLPLTIAASAGIFWSVRRMKNYKTILLVAIIIVTSVTNIGFIAGQVASQNELSGSNDPRRYAPVDLVAALNWLGANAERDAVLFSSYMTGSIAPSMTGLPVYLGHYNLTLYGREKSEQVAAFYSGGLTAESARRLLANGRAKYVIYGPYERAISDRFIAPDWLSLVFSAGTVEVYRVEE
jgi:hypothetical protein